MMTQNVGHHSSTSSSSCPEESMNDFGQLRRPRRQAPPLPCHSSDRQHNAAKHGQVDRNPVEGQEEDDEEDHEQPEEQQRVQSYDSVHTENTLDTLDTLDTNRLDEEEEELDEEEESGHELFFGQRRSCLGYIVKTLCRRLDYFDDENEIHLDFLTATQLQRIIDTYKSRFRLSHPNLVYSQFGLPSYSTPTTTFSSSSCSSNSNEESFFGINVNDIERRTGGLQLPPFIEQLLLYLMRTGAKSIGIFRKSGVKSRIATLKECCDRWPNLGSIGADLLDKHLTYEQAMSSLTLESKPAEIENNRLESLLNKFSVFDVADTLKMWLRELRPGPLISQAVVLAHKDLVEGRSSIQEFHLNFFSLLTDAQRYVLLILLHMLSWFAQNCSQNHMTIQNLSICFAPSLCEIRRAAGFTSPGNISTTSAINAGNVEAALRTPNSKSNPYSASFPPNSLLNTTTAMESSGLATVGISGSSSADSIYASEAEALNDAQKCLEHLIENFEHLLYFNSDLLACSFESKASSQLPGYNQNNGSVYLINGGNLLPQKYESSVSVTAAPVDILHRILYERNLLDPSLIRWDIGESSNKSNGEFADRFKAWKQTSIFLPIKKIALNRHWSFFDPSDNGKANQSSSTNKPPKNPKLTSQGVLLTEEGFLYQSVYKITTNGEGKSLVRHSVAYDLRGHSFYWYQKIFPLLIDFQLERLRKSFQIHFSKGKHKATNI